MSFFKGFYQRKIALFGLITLFLIIVMAIFAPFISPYDPMDMNPVDRLQGPSWTHFFGTDNFGRDIFSRVVYGARLSLLSGTAAVGFSVVIGIIIGTISGYFEKVDVILMRLVDVLMAFPSLMLALAMVAIMGRGLINVIIAVGVVYFTRLARITYGLTLTVCEDPYIEAAGAIGASHARIITRHVIPNLISPIIVQASFTFAFSLLQIAALDFLGVGVPPQIPSWGGMLNEGKVYITRAPWLLVFPGLFIVLTVLSFNLIGDTLRDQLDPRFQSEVRGG
ncbi:MAG: ABC transporter permease [Candidatus Acetothermia bacterium]